MDDYILYTPLKIEDVIKSIPNVEDGGFTNIHNSRYNIMYKVSLSNSNSPGNFRLGQSDLAFPLVCSMDK